MAEATMLKGVPPGQETVGSQHKSFLPDDASHSDRYASEPVLTVRLAFPPSQLQMMVTGIIQTEPTRTAKPVHS